MSKIIVNPEEMKIAKQLARKFSSRWSAVEQDDVQGHLHLWMCEHQTALERWREEEGGLGKLNVALSREASKYCSAQQTESNGGELEYDLQYTAKQIEGALPFLWEFNEYGMQQSVPEHPSLGSIITDTQPLSGQTFNTAITIMADISSGYFQLPKEDQKILALRYRDGLTFGKLGKHYNISEDAARKRVVRAIDRLSGKLTSSANIHIRMRGTINGT